MDPLKCPRKPWGALRGTYDLLILDLDLPERAGFRIVEALKRVGLPTEFIVLVQNATLDEVVSVVRSGAVDVLQKPLSRTEFVDSVLRTLERRCRSPHYLANRLNLYLLEHAKENSFQLGDLCRRFRISRGHATRLFQKHLGTTFRERLVQYRVEKAKKTVDFNEFSDSRHRRTMRLQELETTGRILPSSSGYLTHQVPPGYLWEAVKPVLRPWPRHQYPRFWVDANIYHNT